MVTKLNFYLYFYCQIVCFGLVIKSWHFHWTWEWFKFSKNIHIFRNSFPTMYRCWKLFNKQITFYIHQFLSLAQPLVLTFRSSFHLVSLNEKSTFEFVIMDPFFHSFTVTFNQMTEGISSGQRIFWYYVGKLELLLPL